MALPVLSVKRGCGPNSQEAELLVDESIPTRNDIKQLLKKGIRRGDLVVGDRVPSEYKLVD